MQQVETIKFADLDSRDEALVIVRAERGCAALALSLMQDGDIQVVLGPNELDRVIEALQKARAIVNGSANPD
jgi:hypothetical protein